MPIINGPNEGLAIMYMIYFITAWQGPDVWTSVCNYGSDWTSLWYHSLSRVIIEFVASELAIESSICTNNYRHNYGQCLDEFL